MTGVQTCALPICCTGTFPLPQSLTSCCDSLRAVQWRSVPIAKCPDAANLRLTGRIISKDGSRKRCSELYEPNSMAVHPGLCYSPRPGGRRWPGYPALSSVTLPHSGVTGCEGVTMPVGVGLRLVIGTQPAHAPASGAC